MGWVGVVDELGVVLSTRIILYYPVLADIASAQMAIRRGNQRRRCDDEYECT